MTIEEEMQAIWRRIEDWLKHEAAEVYEELRPGASEALIQQTEKKMHIILPEEVKALYRLHDGGFFVDIWGLCSLESIWRIWEYAIQENVVAEEWEDLQQAFPDPFRWLESSYQFDLPPWGCHSQWFPFMKNKHGDYYNIDLLPGQVGQVIWAADVYAREATRNVVAPSVRDFFTRMADELEAGKYHCDEATGRLWSQESWAALSESDIEHCKRLHRRYKLQKAILAVPEVAVARLDAYDVYNQIDVSLLPEDMQECIQAFRRRRIEALVRRRDEELNIRWNQRHLSGQQIRNWNSSLLLPIIDTRPESGQSLIDYLSQNQFDDEDLDAELGVDYLDLNQFSDEELVELYNMLLKMKE